LIIVQSKRAPLASIQQRYPGAVIFDLTSRGPQPWVRLSPFYPHGALPVPFSPGYTSASVEGIWQGLKVFEHADVDPSRFAITAMKGLKRSERAYGRILGHRQGVSGEHLLSYARARRAIYLPVYHRMLTRCVADLLTELEQYAATQTVILLDYETHCDLNDLSHPLSHAGLVKCYLEGQWPQMERED
jgi:hypothetical protein